MNNIVALNAKQQPAQVEQPHGMTRPFHGFEIPEWMFDARPHMVSRNDPASLGYVCQTCGLMEAKHVKNGWLRRRCECEMQMYLDEGQEEAKAEMKAFADMHIVNRTYTWLGDSEDDLSSKSFEDFTRAYQKKAYDECEAWSRGFIEARKYNDTYSRNILMVGSFGTGKTHLATAVLNALRAQCIPCLFCTAQGFFDVLYGNKFDAQLTFKESASMTPLLVIDELDKLYYAHKDDPAEAGKFQRSTLAEILDKRYKRRLPTIITTNEQGDLGQWLNGATISRLMERITILSMNGLDYRSKGAS